MLPSLQAGHDFFIARNLACLSAAGENRLKLVQRRLDGQTSCFAHSIGEENTVQVIGFVLHYTREQTVDLRVDLFSD
jgi:hypothetical protein